MEPANSVVRSLSSKLAPDSQIVHALPWLNAGKCVLALSLLLAIGCASTPKRAWVKDGATQADFKRDAYACERDVRQVFPNQPITDNPLYHVGMAFQGAPSSRAPLEMFHRCMEAQGYELRRIE